MTKKSHSKHYSRCCAIQALYQWQHTGDTAIEIIEQFDQEKHLKKADKKYFRTLVTGAIDNQTKIDELFIPNLDRDIQTINPVELAILRMATYELFFHPELPYRVIINEALEIAKDFGADQSYKYVNAVLDAVAAKLRVHEYK